MYLAAVVILSIELIFGVAAASPSQKNHSNSRYIHTRGNVLGESDNNPDQQPTDTPAQSQDQPTVAQTDTQQDATPTEVPVQNTSDQSQSTTQIQQEQPQTDSTQPTTGENAAQAEGQQQGKGATSSNQGSQDTQQPSVDVTVSPDNTSAQQNSEQININQGDQKALITETNADMSTLDSQVFPGITSQNPSEQLTEQTVNDVTQQENQLNNAKLPEEQLNLLTNFATNSIQNVNTNLRINQYDDMAYFAQRFSQQIDTSINTIAELPQAKAIEYRNKLSELCKNTEYLLRSEQLVVPEDTEQTLYITRGKCFNLVK